MNERTNEQYTCTPRVNVKWNSSLLPDLWQPMSYVTGLPRHGGAGIGDRHANGMLNGWDGNPQTLTTQFQDSWSDPFQGRSVPTIPFGFTGDIGGIFGAAGLRPMSPPMRRFFCKYIWSIATFQTATLHILRFTRCKGNISCYHSFRYWKLFVKFIIYFSLLNLTLFILQRLRNKLYNLYQSCSLTTYVCVRVVFVWVETGVPGGNPPVWLGAHMTISHADAGYFSLLTYTLHWSWPLNSPIIHICTH